MGPKVCVISVRITNPTWRRDGRGTWYCYGQPDTFRFRTTTTLANPREIIRDEICGGQCCVNSYGAENGSDNESGTKVLAEKQRIIMPPGSSIAACLVSAHAQIHDGQLCCSKKYSKGWKRMTKENIFFNISNVWPQIRQEMPKLGADRG